MARVPRIDCTNERNRIIALVLTSARLRRYRQFALNQNVGQNALLLGSNIGAGFCGYLLHAILGRLLGPPLYGTVASLLALSAVLLFPTQVISTVVAKDTAVLDAAGATAQIHDRVRRLTAILLPVGVVLAALVLVASGPIANFLRLNSAWPVVMLGLMFAVAVAAPVNVGVFQGRRNFGAYAVFLVLPVALRAALACGLALVGLGVSGAMLGVTLSIILSYLLSFVPLRSLLAGPRVPSGSLQPLVSSAITTLIALGSTVLLYNLDTLLAKHLLSAQAAGLYAALATVGKAVLVVSNSVVMVMFPRFAALHSRGERSTRVVLRAILGTIVLALTAEIPFLIVPTLIIHIVVGASFASVGVHLGWYGCAMILFAVAQIFIYDFLARGDRLFALPILACCGLQVVLFYLHHDTVGDLVTALVVSKALLALSLVGLFFVRRRYESA